ncbi:hypothetical protein BGX38DRAFT_1170754 [Terfezia claveryi]|nr:hypothetical protein BGX38DRAFT_1170754 [Terfezia claveryi]
MPRAPVHPVSHATMPHSQPTNIQLISCPRLHPGITSKQVQRSGLLPRTPPFPSRYPAQGKERKKPAQHLTFVVVGTYYLSNLEWHSCCGPNYVHQGCGKQNTILRYLFSPPCFSQIVLFTFKPNTTPAVVVTGLEQSLAIVNCVPTRLVNCPDKLWSARLFESGKVKINFFRQRSS